MSLNTTVCGYHTIPTPLEGTFLRSVCRSVICFESCSWLSDMYATDPANCAAGERREQCLNASHVPPDIMSLGVHLFHVGPSVYVVCSPAVTHSAKHSNTQWHINSLDLVWVGLLHQHDRQSPEPQKSGKPIREEWAYFETWVEESTCPTK